MTKNTAKTIVAATLASALALAGAAAPALATTATTEPAIVAQSQELTPLDALYIAEDWMMVPDYHVDWFYCEQVSYNGHECYEITFHEARWYNPELGWVMGDNMYVVYVGAVTGNVYGWYSF